MHVKLQDCLLQICVFFSLAGNIEQIIEKRTMEVSNFVEMLRSASEDERKAKAHGTSHNDWKVSNLSLVSFFGCACTEFLYVIRYSNFTFKVQNPSCMPDLFLFIHLDVVREF